VHRDAPLTHEIMVRTDARLFDLMIALAGGAAGAIAVTSSRVSGTVVGVAVATALVPPLATAGLLFARGAFALGGGALLLALTNVVAIEFAFATIFWVGGYRRVVAAEGAGPWVFVRRNAVGLAALLVLAGILVVRLHFFAVQARFEGEARAVLLRHFPDTEGFAIGPVTVGRAGRAGTVDVTITGPEQPAVAALAGAEHDLPRMPDGTVALLRVRFTRVFLMSGHGEVRGAR
jgi:hypothetical protein